MWDELGVRTGNVNDKAIRARMAAKSKRPLDYFRQYYADTVVGGSVPALRCGLDVATRNASFLRLIFPMGRRTACCSCARTCALYRKWT